MKKIKGVEGTKVLGGDDFLEFIFLRNTKVFLIRKNSKKLLDEPDEMCVYMKSANKIAWGSDLINYNRRLKIFK